LALVAFDLDGTLLRGSTVCECIADGLGRRAEMARFERLTAQDDIRGISNFKNGHGLVVQCVDGTWSHSGALRGARSGHGG